MHLVAATVVAVALAGVAAVFTLVRPTDERPVIPAPADNDLPYTAVSYTAEDARRAFAAEGIDLSPRSHSPTVTTLGNHADVLEVDSFGDPDQVKQSGFSDSTVANGRYVHFPRACASGARDAERWRGSVRVIVNCVLAGSASSSWLRRVERALARL